VKSEAQVWLLAAADLGIRVTAPFAVTTKEGSISFDALVHDFGSNNGMLLFSKWDKEKAAAATASGYGFSCISSTEYGREATIEALRDWGWGGPESERPEWCTEPLSEDKDEDE
jgi:hypothetical protein